MQLLYLVTMSAHAACGSFAVEKSMHSSRAAFSSLHTQQGLGFAASLGLPAGLLEAARLLICEESAAGGKEMLAVDWEDGLEVDRIGRTG